ncbi:histone deacetylase [Persicobacter psychrovividus]|uniref:Histone deacetylase n=1 Tax=Persicobacter psychrovividus TaxID=387638 RepID=A0ABM7VDH9_9BACT|nr:histone deacetylase [Persicobacter psychrovividus]
MLKIAYHPTFCLNLPEGHRFPMAKYELLPQQLLYEGTVNVENFFEPSIDARKWILQTHAEDYVHRLENGQLSKAEIRRSGFPWSREMVDREFLLAAGTIEATQFAMRQGVAMNIAGGTHHAYADKGEGFCLLNDQAIAANYLLDQHALKKILILDLDVHQGNGTAEIFAKQDRVYTFSMHGAKNYPMKKEASDWDIGCPDGMNDEEYLAVLQDALAVLMKEVSPEFIFFQSGVDVLATDKLGRLSLTIEGCKRRDQLVIEWAKNNNVPMTICMGGGYSEKIADIVNAHANTYRLVQSTYF